MDMAPIEIVEGYIPGSIGRVAELHGRYYTCNWGFSSFFEGKVATELAEFIRRYESGRDGFWTASINGVIEGSITLDGLHAESEGANLRWFIVSENSQGQGIGSQLIETALGFCRSRGCKRAFLWSFEGLGAACHLYHKYGFKVVKQHPGSTWGTEVNEQFYELRLG